MNFCRYWPRWTSEKSSGSLCFESSAGAMWWPSFFVLFLRLSGSSFEVRKRKLLPRWAHDIARCTQLLDVLVCDWCARLQAISRLVRNSAPQRTRLFAFGFYVVVEMLQPRATVNVICSARWRNALLLTNVDGFRLKAKSLTLRPQGSGRRLSGTDAWPADKHSKPVRDTRFVLCLSDPWLQRPDCLTAMGLTKGLSLGGISWKEATGRCRGPTSQHS